MLKEENEKEKNNNMPKEEGLLIVTSIIKSKEREPKKSIPSKEKEKIKEKETNNDTFPIFKEKNENKKEKPEEEELPIFTGKNGSEEEKPEEEELSISEEKNDFKQEDPEKKTPSLTPLDETNKNKNVEQELKKKEPLISGNIKLDPKHMFTTVSYDKSKIKMNKSNSNIKTNENEEIAFNSNDVNPQNKNINNIKKFINLKAMNANEFQISIPNNEYCEYLKYKDEFHQFLSKKRKSDSGIPNKGMILADEKAKIIHEKEDSYIEKMKANWNSHISRIKEEREKFRNERDVYIRKIKQAEEKLRKTVNEEEEYGQNFFAFIKSIQDEIKP